MQDTGYRMHDAGQVLDLSRVVCLWLWTNK